MKKTLRLLSLILLCFLCCGYGCSQRADSFISVNEDGVFVRDGKPYYFIGTNFWYGPILGSQGEGGDRERLIRELDRLQEIGLTNLRVLVGVDGEAGVRTRVEPTLQVKAGVYNDEVMDGLDFFMNELRKRQMTAVLYLTNAWEWSGGYSTYLNWAGYGPIKRPAVDGWPAFFRYAQQFLESDAAKELFLNHVKHIISRTNRYNHIKYSEDATIMSWQICNEPRAFKDANKELYAEWIANVAATIKSLAPHQLVSTGSEGWRGCRHDKALYRRIHADKNIDYLNIHIWPYNWGWVKKDDVSKGLDDAIENTKEYIDEHLVWAEEMHKPVVLEEFGYPRDGFGFTREATTHCRDKYYQSVFELIVQYRKEGKLFGGCNFWGWGGYAQHTPQHVYWEKGDDYMGDPAQEQQGLNSVFEDDTTVDLIKSYCDKLNQ